MKPLTCLTRLAPLALLALTAFGIVHVRTERLSFDFGMQAGDVKEYAASADGQWLVYRANAVDTAVDELYVVAADGSTEPMAISGGRDVLAGFQIAPDGSRVVFLCVRIGRTRIYSAPLLGGPLVELSGTMPSGADGVEAFQITPDGQRVLYEADENTANVNELFVAPTDGSLPSASLSGPPTVGSGLFEFLLTPDGTQAVYRGAFTASWHELHAVPVDGSASPVRLHDAPVHGGEVFEYGVSGDSQSVIFLADIVTNGTEELFHASIDGSAVPWVIHSDEPELLGISPHTPVAIYSKTSGCCQLQLWAVSLDGSQTETLLVSGSVFDSYWDLTFSQNGQWLVYRRFSGSRAEVFSVPLDASTAATKLNTVLPVDGSIHGFLITPDSSDVVYWGEQEAAFAEDIYRVPIDDSAAPLRLTDPGSDAFQATLAGSRVVYVERNTPLDTLMSVPLDGSSSPVLLHTPPTPGHTIAGGFEVTDVPGLGPQVFFTGDLMTDGLNELYRTAADGTGLEELVNGPLAVVPFSFVSSFAVASDESRVFYLETAFTTDGVYEVPLEPRGPVTPFSVSLSNHVELLPTPDGSRVLVLSQDPFLADLHTLPLDGSSPPQLLWTSGALAIEFSPDGNWISFLDNDYTVGIGGPFGAPVDGSSAALSMGGGIYSDTVGFSADSSLLVSVSGGSSIFGDEPNRVWSAPVDGSPKIELLPAPVLDTRRIFDARLTPDRSQVVYLIDEGTGASEDLAVVPIDGSGSPTMLATQSQASEPTPTPDNTRTLFVAERDVAGRNELYIVPLDGSSAPLKLSGAMGAGGNVEGRVVVTPDGLRALYRADALQDEVFELFSVPLDGSAAPVRVSGTMVAGGDVVGSNLNDPPYTVTPDGQTVLYRADQEDDFRFGLYAAPVDGSGPPVRVHPPLTSAFGVELEHLVLADSSAVIYRANLIPGQTDLWISRLDGSRTRRLSDLDATGGEVQPNYAIVGEHVYYLADERIEGRSELYRSQLFPRRNRAASPGSAPSRTVGAGQ